MPSVLDYIRFFTERGDRQAQAEMNRLALEKARRELEMFNKPIYEEPSAVKAGGGVLGDIAEQRGLVSGYKSPVTWGKLGMLHQAGYQPQLSERDIQGLGVEGMYKPPQPRQFAPQWDWFEDEQGNIVPVRKGTRPGSGLTPYQKPTDLERDIEAIQGMESTQKNQPQGPTYTEQALDWISRLLGGKKAIETGTEKAPDEGWQGPGVYEINGKEVEIRTLEDYKRLIGNAEVPPAAGRGIGRGF